MSRKIKCPTCRKERTWEGNPYRPFCSERCRLIDLGRWAQEHYRIPADEANIPSNDNDEDEESRKRQ